MKTIYTNRARLVTAISAAGVATPTRRETRALQRSDFRYHEPVPRDEAIEKIQEACKQIALQFMKIHPQVPKLEDPETQNACLESLHEMTVRLETIKKRLIKLQQRDDSAEL